MSAEARAANAARIAAAKKVIAARHCTTIHNGVTCDGCGMDPIFGPRYNCKKDVCNYDLCRKCYEQPPATRPVHDIHTSDHTFRIMLEEAESDEEEEEEDEAPTVVVDARATALGQRLVGQPTGPFTTSIGFQLLPESTPTTDTVMDIEGGEPVNEEDETDEAGVTLGESMLIDSDEEEEEDAPQAQDLNEDEEEEEEEEEQTADNFLNILHSSRVTSETRELFERLFDGFWTFEGHPLDGVSSIQFYELVMFYDDQPNASEQVKQLWQSCQRYLDQEAAVEEEQEEIITAEQEDAVMDDEDDIDRSSKEEWMTETMAHYEKVFGVDFKWGQIQPLLTSSDVMTPLVSHFISILLADISPIDADAPVSDLPLWDTLRELDPAQPTDQMKLQALTAIMDLAIEVVDDEIEEFEVLQDKNEEIMEALEYMSNTIPKLLNSLPSSMTPAATNSTTIVSSTPDTVQNQLQRELKLLNDFIASCQTTDRDFSDIEPIQKKGRGFGGAGFGVSSATPFTSATSFSSAGPTGFGGGGGFTFSTPVGGFSFPTGPTTASGFSFGSQSVGTLAPSSVGTSTAQPFNFGGASLTSFVSQPLQQTPITAGQSIVSTANATQSTNTVTVPVAPATSVTTTTNAMQSSASDRLNERIPLRQSFLTELHQRVSELLSPYPHQAAVWREALRHLSVILEQRHTETVVPTRSMELLIREIAQDFRNNLEFEPEAFDMIQEAAEQFLTQQFDYTGGYRAQANTSIAGLTRQEIETLPTVPIDHFIHQRPGTVPRYSMLVPTEPLMHRSNKAFQARSCIPF